MAGDSFERHSSEKAWTVLAEDGREAVSFTSFVGVDYANESQAPHNPVEEGGFANYNKVQSPAAIRLTLAVQGSDFEIERVLEKLNRFSGEAKKLIVVTPSMISSSLTLTNVSYSRKTESGATLLTVDLDLVEVREVRSQVTTSVITRPKNPTSASKENTGRKQASVLNHGFGRVF